MATLPDRAQRLRMPSAPGSPNAPRRSAGRDEGGSTQHALWWVVCYQGARDYAQAISEATEPTGQDAGHVLRPIHALYAGTPAYGM